MITQLTLPAHTAAFIHHPQPKRNVHSPGSNFFGLTADSSINPLTGESYDYAAFDEEQPLNGEPYIFDPLQHEPVVVRRRSTNGLNKKQRRYSPYTPPSYINHFHAMPGPIDISGPGQATSNLTSALRAAGEVGRPAEPIETQPTTITGSNHAMAATTGGINIAGAKSSGKAPRESMAASDGMKSLMGGMSWGGVSVGSWIRDDIIMTGTSPFQYQSPSYHSSSYLPKFEANFFRDFSCCGQTLPSLHDLLQHYEEVHAQQLQNGQLNLPPSLSKDGGALAGAHRQQLQHQQRMAALAAQNQAAKRGERLSSMSIGGGGVDVAEDMEMDDIPTQNLQSALRVSNPTVSSVNTPNLPNPTTPSTDRYLSPESSVPGTPGNPDLDSINFQNMNLGNYMTTDEMGLELCIDDPGKHLFNQYGTGAPKATGFPQNINIQSLKAARDQSELARRLGAEGLLHPNMAGASIAGDVTLPQGWQFAQEDKPFKCPVIGCEKAYKNQNGLKYHRNVRLPNPSEAHCTQLIFFSFSTATRTNNYIQIQMAHSVS